MITIGQYTQAGFAGYRPEEFEAAFLEICGEHRTENRALLFAILLYDFRHPQVIKVLRDLDYWKSLDVLSGTSLSVFAFHSPADTVSWSSSDLPEFDEQARKVLKTYFDIGDNPPMPSILFFQVAGDSVICHYLVKIRAATIEGAFCEINDILQEAVTAVEK